MAQETVGIKIEVQGGETIGNLKKDLKEANLALIQAQKNFGEYSKEAIAAAQKVAGLKDSIQEAKETADLFDPGKKFQAFTGVLSSVAGGISAVQGAFGLLGAEGKQVEQALLKVQSALALSQGLSTIRDSAKDFQRLNAIIQSTAIFQKANNAATAIAITLQKAFGVATVGTGRAFTILKGAIAATGIGLLVVGLTTLIGKISEWTSASEDAANAQKKLAEQNEVVNASLQNQIDVLTAVGNKEKEILALKKQQIDNELNVLRTSAKAKGELTLDELKKFRDLKTQKEVLDIEEQNRLKKIDEDAKKKQDDKNKEAAERGKALREKRKQENDEILQEQKDAAQNIRDLQDEIFLQSIQDETQRALVKLSQDKERQINEINSTRATAEQKAQQIALVEQKFQQDKDVIETDAKKKREEKEKSDSEKAAAKLKERLDLETQIRLDSIKNEFERKKEELLVQEENEKIELEKKRADGLISEEAFQQALLNIRDKYAKATTEVQKNQAENEKKIQEARKTAQLELIDTIGGAFGQLSQLFGQTTAAGKAFALGEIAINLATGFARGMTIAQQSAAATGPGAAFAYPIFYAQQIVSVLGAINKARGILKTVKGGGASAPSIGSTSAPSVSAPIAPQAPQAQLTQLDQTTINRMGSATNRSYVLESDVTNSQERITRINRAARLN
jgi:hypothetical protein